MDEQEQQNMTEAQQTPVFTPVSVMISRLVWTVALGIGLLAILADTVIQAGIAFADLQVKIEDVLNSTATFNLQVKELEGRVGAIDLSEFDSALSIGQLESRTPEELDSITDEIELRLKLFEKRLKVITPVLKEATEDVIENVTRWET